MTSGWHLGKSGLIEGSRDKVKQAITAQPDVPTHWKTLLLAEIDSLPAAHNWVAVHGHNGIDDTARTLHMHISSSTENI